jgi:hypothetical protein
VFVAEEVDGLGDKVQKITHTLYRDTLVAFLVDLHIWGPFLSCRVIRIYGGSAFN